MRTRLINPFWVLIARIDYDAGLKLGSYDPQFRDVRTVTVAGQRKVLRQEKATIRVRAQVEADTFNRLRMFDAGDSPESKITIALDMHWLRRANLVDAETGLPRLRLNDRLVEIRDTDDQLVHKVKDPPGLYCVEAAPGGYGFGGRANLFLMRFNDRALSQTT